MKTILLEVKIDVEDEALEEIKKIPMHPVTYIFNLDEWSEQIVGLYGCKVREINSNEN